MEFWQVVKQRRSIRRFKRKVVGDGKLVKILEAARLAPSAHNWQAYKIVVVKDRQTKEKLAAACLGQQFVAQAPVVLVFCADQSFGEARERFLYSLQDATIACYQAWLAAVDLGLGAVWVGAFVEEEVQKILPLPKHLVPIAVLPIGYPAESPPPRPRKPLAALLYPFSSP